MRRTLADSHGQDVVLKPPAIGGDSSLFTQLQRGSYGPKYVSALYSDPRVSAARLRPNSPNPRAGLASNPVTAC